MLVGKEYRVDIMQKSGAPLEQYFVVRRFNRLGYFPRAAQGPGGDFHFINDSGQVSFNGLPDHFYEDTITTPQRC